MQVVIGVVGHESRREMALRLVERVGAVDYSIDDGSLGCNGNHIKVLRALRQNNQADFYCVLEDDAQPIPDFLAQLRAALKEAPTQIVSLYLGTSNPIHWQDAIRRSVAAAESGGHAWITSTHLIHGVGYCIHRDLIDAIIEHLHPDFRPIDEQVSAYTYPNHILVSYTYPSLVQHEDGPSCIAVHADGAPRDKPRKAWAVGGRTNWRSRTVLLT